MTLPQLLISMLLFLVLFFGIGFLLNMLLRATWVMAVIYPLVVIFIVDKIQTFNYVKDFNASINTLKENLLNLGFADVTILTTGFVGALLSGIIIRLLRTKGYQMF